MHNKLAIGLSLLLLAGCGGSGDSSGGAGSGVIPTPAATTASTLAEVDNFVVADGSASYDGEQRLAVLNTANATDYVRMVFSPALGAPDVALRAGGWATGLQLADADFIRSQEMLLAQLAQAALAQYRYGQRTVNMTNSQSCQNNGSISLSGELYETVGKAKLKLTYSACETGGYILQGEAFLLIYAVHEGSFNEWSSFTLSYNQLQAQRVSDNEGVLFTGTLDEVKDYNTGSTRKTTQLHRQVAAADSDKQTLTQLVRQATGANGSVTMSGALYEGLYGQAQIKTLRPLIYNTANAPVSGYLTMTGLNNSRIAVTALGQQYDATTARDVILLQVDIDANGDGVYENLSQVNVDDL